jgi:hypothetical protein
MGAAHITPHPPLKNKTNFKFPKNFKNAKMI